MRLSKFITFFTFLFVLTSCGGGGSKTTSASSAPNNPSSSSISSVSSNGTSSSAANSSTTPHENVQLGGTAAVGAPIINGQVLAKCQDGSGFLGNVVTNSNGAFTGLVGAEALPCALQVNSGTPDIVLHSFAFAPGTINITPLTDIILTRLNLELPSVWFANGDFQTANNLSLVITTQNLLKDVLEAGGYTIPAGAFSPFTIPFSIGDGWDQLLDQIQASINESSNILDYDALLTLIKDGSMDTFPRNAGTNSSASSFSSSAASSSSSAGSEHASSCFDSPRFNPGTQIITHHRITYHPLNSNSSETVVNAIYKIDVKPMTTFNGQIVLQTDTVQVNDGVESDSISTDYFKVDFDMKRVISVGSSMNSPSVPLTQISTITPESVERFDLAANESYTQIYTIFSASNTAGVEATNDFIYTRTVTFIGIETITVPAGTYTTCRFQDNTNGMEMTRWISTTGMVVRTKTDHVTQEMVSNTINGF